MQIIAYLMYMVVAGGEGSYVCGGEVWFSVWELGYRGFHE